MALLNSMRDVSRTFEYCVFVQCRRNTHHRQRLYSPLRIGTGTQSKKLEKLCLHKIVVGAPHSPIQYSTIVRKDPYSTSMCRAIHRLKEKTNR